MIRKALNTSALLILLSLLLFSCKKNTSKTLQTDALTGAWEEVPQQAYSRRLLFESGGKFTLQRRDGTNTNWALIQNGKYTIAGDNLAVTITDQQEKQASGTTIKTAVNISLFDKGKFNIKNFVLTINYKTYPADAPVDTESKFNKILPID